MSFTGGEPLVRKDAALIIEKLASLPIELAITTNGVIVDKFIDTFKKIELKKINVSLDILNNVHILLEPVGTILKRSIQYILVNEGFEVKISCVLIKDFNEHEIIYFIVLIKNCAVQIRFIEFTSFDGNNRNLEKLVSTEEVWQQVYNKYDTSSYSRLNDVPNDTAKNIQIRGYKGTFAVIGSVVTNPFCDSCNRIRLTVNG
ncbi:radical SAM protein [Maribacter sp. 1_MG-2023]|uniref:radical SAM protein n=1 Tax=Maribacter sp. 1_MG-2023 TaxID=3062677 RepID=UPI0026E19153|nr:radical SAM protein [Maribacter sp. 1_MG-2023]MDO6471758.1 radical SAM protein [Maribacter sp. 1_MG-2023]